MAGTPKHKDRLTAVDASFLGPRGRHAHAHRGSARVRGTAARTRGLRGARRVAAAPRPALPAEARPPALRDGAPDVDRRPVASTSATTCAIRRCPRPARSTSCASWSGASSPSAWTARSRSGRSGSSRASSDNRFAVISKVHHALVDGVSGVDLTTVMFDTAPDGHAGPAEGDTGARTASRPTASWSPKGSRASSSCPFGLARKARVAWSRRPAATLESVREAAEGMGEVVWSMVNPAPEDAAQPRHRHAPARALGRDLARRPEGDQGRARRHRQRRLPDGRRRARCRSGCTARGIRTEGLQLRGCVPVSIRAEGRGGGARQPDHDDDGPLPVFANSPRERYRIVQRVDGGPEGVEAGAGRGDDREPAGLRAADDPRAGVAAELLEPLLQPARDQRPGPAVPDLPAGARAAAAAPGRRSWRRATRWRSRS